VDHNPTARTQLTGECRIDRYDLLPGAFNLDSKDGEECRPSRVRNGLGEVVIPHHVGDPQLLVIDHIIGSH
jgi:hypothetical protein